MAKKDSGVFQLVSGVFEIVASRIYTMLLDVEGEEKPREVPEASLVTGVNPDGSKAYRFGHMVAIPSLRKLGPDATLDDLAGAIREYAAAVEQYDNATMIRNTKGDKEIARSVFVAVNSSGDRIPVVEFIANQLQAAPRLNVQKQIQKDLRPEAEATLRAELGWAEPAGKPKREKKEKVTVDKEATLFNS